MERTLELLTRIAGFLKEVGERAKVVATALVTWLVVLVAALQVVIDEIAPLLPAPWDQKVTSWLLSAISVVSVAILIIRRVTPVPPEERGILPVEKP